MALSGTITGSIANGNYTLRISWTATQNVSANTSTITAKLYLVQAASWSLNIGTRSTSYNSCTINGTKSTFTSPAIDNGGGATTLLATITQSVPHNADGTKSVAIAGVFGIRATISGTYYASISASATVTLNTIPRTSALTASASAIALGDALTLSVARAASTFTHTLRYTFGTYSGTIATGVATSYTWTTPLTLCNAIPSSTSGNLIVYCDTYNGSTRIGTTSTAITANVPASVVPTITGCTLAEAASSIPDGWMYIEGLSKLKITVTAAGAYGSTVSAYQINVNGATYAGREVTTGELTGSGTQYVSVQVTDSRGRQATKTYPYTVATYSRPTLQDYTVKRVDDSGVDNDEGSNVFVSVSAIVSPAGDMNSGTLVLQYKAASDADWTTLATYDVTALYVEHTVQGISVDSSYEFIATLSDELYTSTAMREIQTATPTVDFKANGQGVALGKVSEYDAFECAMPAIFSSTFTVNGGLNPTNTAGVTSITSSDGAGQYVKLLSFPINTYSGWNYSNLVLSFEECIFGVFSGFLDIHIRNSGTTGAINQQVFACHDCRGNPYHYNFYLTTDGNVASVYWHCRSNYYGISVRVVNGYMPHAGFDGITWDGATKTTTAPGGTLCSIMGSVQESGIWRYRRNADGTLEAWGQYVVNSVACNTALGSMYRTAVIAPTAYPVAFAAAPSVQMTWTNAGAGAFVWATTEGTTTAPPNLYLVRPTSSTALSGTLNIYAIGE